MSDQKRVLETEQLILNSLFTNDAYMRKVTPFLELEYFESPYKEMFKVFATYVAKYNNIPDKYAFTISLNEAKNNLNTSNVEVADLVDLLFGEMKTDTDWLLDKTEQWCQERALYNAVMKSITIIDGKDPVLGKSALPELLQTALSVSFDTNVGHDYIDQAEQRYEFYHSKENKLPLDLEYFNTITNGGLSDKSLAVILASTGVGKSLCMCHMAASTLSFGKNVLYITMEMAEERIAERIDANLFDVPIDQLENLSKDAFLNKVNSVKQKTQGSLIVKEYPTGQAHSGHFRALIRELKLKKNFEPDLICVDYINICASARMKMGGSVNSYTYIKAIAEELRGLAVEVGVPVLTATQINREGSRNSDPNLEDTSESWGLPATADLMFALVSNEELEELGQIMVKQLKNRYSDPNKNKKFVVGIDRPKMRLYDVDDSQQTLINKPGNEDDPGPVFDSTPFGQRAPKGLNSIIA